MVSIITISFLKIVIVTLTSIIPPGMRYWFWLIISLMEAGSPFQAFLLDLFYHNIAHFIGKGTNIGIFFLFLNKLIILNFLDKELKVVFIPSLSRTTIRCEPRLHLLTGFYEPLLTRTQSYLVLENCFSL